MSFEDDFVETVPDWGQTVKRSDPGAVYLSVLRIRSSAPRLSLTLPRAALVAMDCHTHRLTCAYSPRRAVLRLRHAVNGPYEMCSVPRGRGDPDDVARSGRRMVRVAVPEGVRPPAGDFRQECRHEVVGRDLLVYLPDAFFPTYSAALPPPEPAKPRLPPPPDRPPVTPASRVVEAPGTPPAGRSALDQGARPGGGLVSHTSQPDPGDRRLLTTRR